MDGTKANLSNRLGQQVLIKARSTSGFLVSCRHTMAPPLTEIALDKARSFLSEFIPRMFQQRTFQLRKSCIGLTPNLLQRGSFIPRASSVSFRDFRSQQRSFSQLLRRDCTAIDANILHDAKRGRRRWLVRCMCGRALGHRRSVGWFDLGDRGTNI